MDPAVGKILGMALAYAISALGLLLAYYNYRKRIVKAEQVFSPAAWGVLIAVLVIAGAAGYLIYNQAVSKHAAIPAPAETAAAAERAENALEVSPGATVETSPGAVVPGNGRLRTRYSGSMVPGIVVPILIFGFSFWVTWALYKHFTKKLGSGSQDGK